MFARTSLTISRVLRRHCSSYLGRVPYVCHITRPGHATGVYAAGGSGGEAGPRYGTLLTCRTTNVTTGPFRRVGVSVLALPGWWRGLGAYTQGAGTF